MADSSIALISFSPGSRIAMRVSQVENLAAGQPEVVAEPTPKNGLLKRRATRTQVRIRKAFGFVIATHSHPPELGKSVFVH